MKKLYTTENKVILYLLKSMLEDHDIVSLIKNDQPPLAGEIPPVEAWPELWIMNDDQFAEAEEILQNELANRAELHSNWTCANCGEQSLGEFNICWKCGSSRSDN